MHVIRKKDSLDIRNGIIKIKFGFPLPMIKGSVPDKR